MKNGPERTKCNVEEDRLPGIFQEMVQSITDIPRVRTHMLPQYKWLSWITDKVKCWRRLNKFPFSSQNEKCTVKDRYTSIKAFPNSSTLPTENSLSHWRHWSARSSKRFASSCQSRSNAFHKSTNGFLGRHLDINLQVHLWFKQSVPKATGCHQVCVENLWDAVPRAAQCCKPFEQGIWGVAKWQFLAILFTKTAKLQSLPVQICWDETQGSQCIGPPAVRPDVRGCSW